MHHSSMFEGGFTCNNPPSIRRGPWWTLSDACTHKPTPTGKFRHAQIHQIKHWQSSMTIPISILMNCAQESGWSMFDIAERFQNQPAITRKSSTLHLIIFSNVIRYNIWEIKLNTLEYPSAIADNVHLSCYKNTFSPHIGPYSHQLLH